MRISAPKALASVTYVGIVKTGDRGGGKGLGWCSIASALEDKAQRVPTRDYHNTRGKQAAMKIDMDTFIEVLSHEMASKDNYQNNLDHNAGRWNYHTIHKCMIDGVMAYGSPCCKSANTDISVIKRVCARN